MVPRRDEKPMQQIEFIPLSEQRVLAIIIINDKEVQNRIIQVERDYAKDELDELSRYLSAEYPGQADAGGARPGARRPQADAPRACHG